ncbi:MAG: methionyl-tRNA formyltransferase [Veillonella sp.]|nr:methionyl-tRNA formyltransferase [Veillonella sp.]
MSNQKQLRVVFMGTPDFSVPTLEALIKAGHSIVGVYCQPDKQKGRGKQVQMPPVKVAALKHNLPVFQPVTLRDEQVQAELENLNPDVVVVIAYGKILPPWLIRLPHKYRGAAPIHYAILNGDTKTGVTIMHMDDGLDTGDIIDIVETDILPGETTGQLFERMAVLGGETIVPVLTRWVNGEIVATPQDDTMATHTAKITKEMGHIDWSKSAHEIVNLIRGLNPAPGCYTYLDGKRLKVWSGEVVPSDTTHCLIDIHGKHVPIAISATTIPGTIVSKIAGLGVYCGDGNIILLTEVQPENKKRISAIDFINGHQIKEGIVFGDSI